MGSFFDNIQVFVGSRDPEELRQVIAATARRLALAGPYVELDDPTIEPDHEILIAPADDTPWLAVYGAFAEGSGEDSRHQAAAALSAAVEGTAVAVMVYDSDVLEMRRYTEGDLVDAYSSDPDCFGMFAMDDVDDDEHFSETASATARDDLAGHVERWRDLLVSGHTAAELRAVWDERRVFADETLTLAAELLGMDPARAGSYYHYLLTDGRQPGDSSADGAIRLRFRLKQPPRYTIPAEGLPALAPAAGSTGMTLSVGEALHGISVGATNQGGAATGLQIVMWGSALTQGLLDLSTIHLLRHQRDASGQLAYAPAVFPLEMGRSGDTPVCFVTLLDEPIPAGTAAGHQFDTDGNRGNIYRAVEAMMATQVTVALEGQALAVGHGELHVGFVPLANREAGQTSWTLDVVVSPAVRRPLRATDEPATMQMRRDLAETRVLVGLIALGSDRASCARAAELAIGRWSKVLGARRRGSYEMLLQRQTHLRPEQPRVPIRDVVSGSGRWEELREVLYSGEQLSGTLPTAEDDDEVRRYSSGFLFDTMSLFFQHGGDTLAPHLVLWLDSQGMAGEALQEAETVLSAILDQLMVSADGLQALLVRWNWSSYYSHGAQSTPYELACGVHGQCTTGQSWCARYLRGVSDTLWLGPALSHRLDIDALDDVATLTTIGDGWRLDRRPEASLDDLERALAPLIPGQDEWISGTGWLYGRDED